MNLAYIRKLMSCQTQNINQDTDVNAFITDQTIYFCDKYIFDEQ